jgi:hypothetical protein
MENLDLKESSGYSDMASKGNSGSVSNYYERISWPAMAMSPATLKIRGGQD